MSGVDLGLDVTDFYCGMGGSSTGLVEAGFSVKVAANHWERAIQTHAANHPDTEHLCADIQAVDLRYLPRTRVLWASPICTEVSPAGGRAKRRVEHDLFEQYGHVPDAAFERTRVTFWEVLRAAEIHRYDAILLENVVEAFDWELMPVFLDGLDRLGYQTQIVSVSAAHVGDPVNPWAPQWRDRVYLRCLPKGVNAPALSPRPKAWCPSCASLVEAVQSWKPIRGARAQRWYRELPVGKYNQQYVYVCPVPTHGRLEPFVVPAAAAIDWSDLGTRIGDRKRPLGAATMRRIATGADMLAAGAFTFTMAYGGSGSPIDVAGAPMRTWTTGDTEGLATAPGFISTHHGGLECAAVEQKSKGLGEPVPGVGTKPNLSLVAGPGLLVAAAGQTWDAASGAPGSYLRAWPTAGSPAPTATTDAQLGLVLPGSFVMAANHDGEAGRQVDPVGRPLTATTGRQGPVLVVDEAYVTMLRNHGGSSPAATEALATFTGGGFHHGLVIPYRKGSSPYPAGEGPLSTLATREQHGVLRGEGEDLAVEDFHFRMLKPREAANAQRFPRSYVIHGNQGEQQMQAGNAVAVNVAHWLGRDTAAVLDGQPSPVIEAVTGRSRASGPAARLADSGRGHGISR